VPGPVVRTAGRVLLLDGQGRVLLFRGFDPADPDAGTWWFTIGGGAEDGESVRAAAARELFEETGLALDAESLGEPVFRELAAFSLAGVDYRQDNHFFVARVESHDVVTEGFTALEDELVLGHQWWSLPELRATQDVVYPETLADVLDRLEV
jgi:8-oxo-dGTP pyrophosphatase MutT (NUDIX family)